MQPDPFQHVVATLLTPLLIAAGISDPAAARAAAVNAINAYRPETPPDLLTITKHIAFSLAAVSSLGAAADTDIPAPVAVRLRANAVACDRAAEQARRTMIKTHAPRPAPQVDEQQLQAQIVQAKQRSAQAMEQQRPQPKPPRQAAHPVQPRPDLDRAAWASAMAQVAEEFAAEIPGLPPQDKWAASMRAKALTSSAQSLLDGVDLEPFRFRPST